jgi:hypothetical protein
MGKEREEFKIHMTYIDSLFLAEDLKRLLPLTVFYAPNEAFEGKVSEITEVSESLLENMVFKESCGAKGWSKWPENVSTLTMDKLGLFQ